jgi:hypothetical protein
MKKTRGRKSRETVSLMYTFKFKPWALSSWAITTILSNFLSLNIL